MNGTGGAETPDAGEESAGDEAGADIGGGMPDPGAGAAPGPAVPPMLISLDVASIVSCRRRPRHIIDYYDAALRLDGIRIPAAIEAARLHGIDLELGRNEQFGRDLERSFLGWWRGVEHLVVPQTEEVEACIARLRATPDIARELDGSPPSIAALSTVATADVYNYGIVTTARRRYAPYLGRTRAIVTILPLKRPNGDDGD